MAKQSRADLEKQLAPIFANLEQELLDAVGQYINQRLADARNALSMDLEAAAPVGRPRKAGVTRQAPAQPTARSASPRKTKKKKKKVQNRVPLSVAMENVRAVLEKQTHAVSIRVVQAETGYTESQARRALRKLVKGRKIQRIGERKDTVYAIAANRAAKKKAPKRTASKTAKK